MTDTDGIPIFMLDLKESLLLAGAVQDPLTEIETYVYNLYDPTNMALAKRAFQWGAKSVPHFNAWLIAINGAYLIALHDDGIRMALDELLFLAIEAGLAEMDENFWHEYYGDVRADDLVSGAGIVEMDDF